MQSIGFNLLEIVERLGYIGPNLLVYLFAAYRAFTYMGRARLPSILTLFGVAISVFATIIGDAFLFYLRAIGPLDERINLLRMVYLAGSCLRAVGLGFLVYAIFVGRDSPSQSDRYLKE